MARTLGLRRIEPQKMRIRGIRKELLVKSLSLTGGIWKLERFGRINLFLFEYVLRVYWEILRENFEVCWQKIILIELTKWESNAKKLAWEKFEKIWDFVEFGFEENGINLKNFEEILRKKYSLFWKTYCKKDLSETSNWIFTNLLFEFWESEVWIMLEIKLKIESFRALLLI